MRPFAPIDSGNSAIPAAHLSFPTHLCYPHACQTAYNETKIACIPAERDRIVTNDSARALLRQLPQVDEILNDPHVAMLAQSVPHNVAADKVRASIDSVRAGILAGTIEKVEREDIVAQAVLGLLSLAEPSLRRVINATGVIIHTNLGRSALAPQAVEAVNDVITGYSTLEYNVKTMARGSRHDHCERLLCALTGAEAAMAVNNNAAAVLIVLAEFAAGKSAVVSRGELVEIGGSFRIPDIMEYSNAHMIEVGATNKTHLRDYERAITPDTAMLLKVHPSNYRMVGFTETVSARDLAEVARKENVRRAAVGADPLLVYEDLGSGTFVDLSFLGPEADPTVAEALKGCGLVSFSGDKLLGGPQAGIIVGSKEHIDRLKKNPLARALRLDKMTLAALEATLRLYLDPEQARRDIPTVRMLTATAAELDPLAQELSGNIEATAQGILSCEVIDEVSRAGGGSLPLYDIPTRCVAVAFGAGSAIDCERYLQTKRQVPIVARIKNERLLVDVRTLMGESEAGEVAAALADYARLQGRKESR